MQEAYIHIGCYHVTLGIYLHVYYWKLSQVSTNYKIVLVLQSQVHLPAQAWKESAMLRDFREATSVLLCDFLFTNPDTLRSVSAANRSADSFHVVPGIRILFCIWTVAIWTAAAWYERSTGATNGTPTFLH